MRLTLSAFAILLASTTICPAQALKDTARIGSLKTPVPQKTSSITLHLERKAGVGPEGHVASSNGTLAQLKGTETVKAYPTMKHVPTDLMNMQQYYYVIDLPQFVFQNYIAGLYSKAYLERMLPGNKFPLKDTVRLSRKPLMCYIAAVSGMRNGELVYMIDEDNDGDFGNDKIRPALSGTTDENVKVNGAVAVKVTYLNNDNKIIEDKRLVFMDRGSHQGTEMNFAFPEYNYIRFVYKGSRYLIATTNHQRTAITLLRDQPQFDLSEKLNAVSIGQYIKIGDDEFTLSNIMNNGNDLVLTGADMSGFGDQKSSLTTATASKGPLKISRQLGYKAPGIKGININPNIKLPGNVDLAKLKGKYVFIDVWGTFCGPCIGEFPYLTEVYTKFDRKDLEFIGLIDDRAPNTTQQIMKQHGLLWPNIQIDAKTSQTEGYKDINAYPTTYLLDREGKIIDIDLRGNALMNKLNSLIKGS